MKRFSMVLAMLLMSLCSAFAQYADVVHWNYAAAKNTDGTYDIVLTGTIKRTWHIYTATPGGDGSQMPTVVKFDRTAGTSFMGKTVAQGKVIKEEIKDLDVTIYYYKDKVVYRQKVKAAKGSTIKGSIEYQPCTDEMCLPPVKNKFSVVI